MHETADTPAIVDDPEGCWMAYGPQCGRSFDVSGIGYQCATRGLRVTLRSSCSHSKIFAHALHRVLGSNDL